MKAAAVRFTSWTGFLQGRAAVHKKDPRPWGGRRVKMRLNSQCDEQSTKGNFMLARMRKQVSSSTDAVARVTFLLAVLAVSVLLPGCSTTPAEWSSSDARWQKAVTASITLDSLSTADAMRRGCNEDNPLLGRYPNDGELLLAAAVGSVTHYLIGRHILKTKWRRAWQVTFVLGHGYLAVHNRRTDCI